MTRRQRRRLPKAKDIALMMRAILACIPTQQAPLHGLRESLKGVVNYRVKSATGGREWLVDIYHGDWIVVAARDFTQPCPSVPSAIRHLMKMLGLKPCR